MHVYIYICIYYIHISSCTSQHVSVHVQFPVLRRHTRSLWLDWPGSGGPALFERLRCSRSVKRSGAFWFISMVYGRYNSTVHGDGE